MLREWDAKQKLYKEYLNNLNIEYYLPWHNHFLQHAKLKSPVLDLGCGKFYRFFKDYFDERSLIYIGCDPLHVKPCLSFTSAIGEYLPYRDNLFASVIILGTLDHVLDVHQVLAEARRVLLDNGVLWIAQTVFPRKFGLQWFIHNFHHVHKTGKLLFDKPDAYEKAHTQFFTLKSLISYLKKAEFGKITCFQGYFKNQVYIEAFSPDRTFSFRG